MKREHTKLSWYLAASVSDEIKRQFTEGGNRLVEHSVKHQSADEPLTRRDKYTLCGYIWTMYQTSCGNACGCSVHVDVTVKEHRRQQTPRSDKHKQHGALSSNTHHAPLTVNDVSVELSEALRREPLYKMEDCCHCDDPFFFFERCTSVSEQSHVSTR